MPTEEQPAGEEPGGAPTPPDDENDKNDTGDQGATAKGAPDTPAKGEPYSPVDATQEARTTAKWLITTLAAAAATIFGAGPLVTQPKLDWGNDNDRMQLTVALLSGAVGIAATVTLIVLIARVLTPARITLDTIRRGLRKQIIKDHAIYLPSRAKNIADLRRRLGNYRLMAANLRAQADDIDRQVADLAPDDPAKEKRDLLSLQRYAAQQLATTEANVAAYQQAADRILLEAQYDAVNRMLGGWQRVAIGALGALALLGGLVYTLALAQPADDDKKAKPPIAAGTIAFMPAPDAGDAAQQKLWNSLGLDAAALPDGTVPVLVNSGAGTKDDPWQVTTICLSQPPGCQAQTFSLLADVYPVREYKPVEVPITYTPSPTATSTQNAGG